MFCIFCVLAVALWWANWHFLDKKFTSLAERGQFGDMFGSVNALFTALAFAGLIYTSMLQKRQLSLQQEELIESGKTQEKLVQKQIDAQQEIFKMQKLFQEEQRKKQVEHDVHLEQLRENISNNQEEKRKQNELEKRNEFTANTLRAIRCELETMYGIYSQGLGVKISELQDGQILNVAFSLSEDWFTVYHTNACNLGMVKSDLSRQIIKVYMLIKSIIEEYRINNSLLNLRIEAGYGGRTGMAPAYDEMLRNEVVKLKKLQKELYAEYHALISMFDDR